jgi:hypothetical protein
VAAKVATGRDGIEEPCQWPKISTPTGRARVKISDSSVVTHPTARIDPRKTKKCRKRLNASSVNKVAHRSIPIVHTELRAWTDCMAVVITDVLNVAIPRSRNASERSIQEPVSVKPTSSRTRKTAPAALSQYLPVDSS